MSAISLESTGTLYERTSEASSAVPMPATVTSGQSILVLWGTCNSASQVTAASGWTTIWLTSRSGGTLIPDIYIAWRLCDGTEGSSVTVTHPNAASIWQITSWLGVNTTTPLDVAVSTNDATATTVASAPTMTPVTAGNALLHFSSNNSATTTSSPPTSPGTFIELADRGTGTKSGAMSYLLNQPASATGTVTATWSVSGAGVAALVALRPAVTALPDTGTATDALTVAATTTLTDTGTGADALTTAAAVPLSDTGASADAVTVAAGVPLPDTGVGADAVTVSAAVPMAETGHGTDALALAAATALAETGSFSDALSIVVTVTLAETGSLADALVVSLPPHSPGFMEIDTPSGATIQILDASGARILPIITIGPTTVLVTPTFTPPAPGGSSAIPSSATYPASILYPGS